jgi:NADH-quinone oxidoreductase subunit L
VVPAAWICLLSPLAAALAIALGGTSISRRLAGYIATASVGISFVATLVAFFALIGRETEEREELSTLWTWLSAGELEFGLSILVDPLSVFMMLVVSGVGFLIVAYSIGYMDGDDEERRYFAYMALFVFSMLLLVQSANFLLLLVGWGLVGLCSYLLIGYHHERPAAVAAAKKAFIMNAIGDATMALALFLLIWEAGSTSLAFDTVPGDGTIATLVALGLLGGAVAKSAQVPLHTWLPDAMEGPTPVSALIHAATMVVAGVYMLVRLSPVFEAAPEVQDLAAGLGAITLLLAGLIALVQTDIKRVIAYSTCSQLGYMFAACGVSAYPAAIFHLGTHAFFKSLLFLSAGSVITALHEEQDMRNMGGLWRKLPITYAVMFIGSLALAGIPFFAGYYSKDFILEATWASQASFAHWAYWGGTLGAGLTALYIFRLMFMTFHGTFRQSDEAFAKIHESPWVMTIPLMVLAFGAAFGGMIGQVLIEPDMAIWDGSIFVLPQNNVLEAAHHIPALAQLLPLILALAGIAIAFVLYILRPAWPALLVPKVRPIYTFLVHKWYFDELYDFLFVRPAMWIGYHLWQRGDRGVIDGYGPDGVAAASIDIARRAMRLQTGYLYHYAFAMLIGVALLVTWYLFVIQG